MTFDRRFARLVPMLAFALATASDRARSAETSNGALGFVRQGIEECERRRDELGGGNVVYIEQQPAGGRGVALSACGLVEAPPSEVWPVLRNCQEYREFFPGVTESALRDRRGDVAICQALIDLPFPLGALSSIERATKTTTADGSFERRWTLESGTYRRLEGLWTLRPWGKEGRRTLLVYQLDMDPETVIPNFLLRRAQSATAPDVFASVRERVLRCRGAAPPAGCRID